MTQNAKKECTSVAGVPLYGILLTQVNLVPTLTESKICRFEDLPNQVYTRARRGTFSCAYVCETDKERKAREQFLTQQNSTPIDEQKDEKRGVMLN